MRTGPGSIGFPGPLACRDRSRSGGSPDAVLVDGVGRHDPPGVSSRTRRTAALLAAACLVPAGCGSERPGTAPDLVGDWELVELWRGGSVQPAPVAGRATLVVEDDGLSGTSFCNSYSGSYDLEGDDLTIGGLGGTDMGCEPDLMDAEAAYLEALAVVNRAGMDEGFLTLTGPDVELRFRTLPPVPTSELVGTRWVLETLLDGEVASSTLGEPAELELSDDGTLTGSTGCRELTGAWTVQGDLVHLTDLDAGTDECPRNVRPQDAQVVEVLGDGFQVQIAGDSLTLTETGGLGLVYRAA